MVSYRSYLALPYPKVIVQSGVSIGMPDESSLIVLFVDCRTRSFMYNTLSMILRDFNRIVRNGKYLVLVEDALLRHGNGSIPADLGHFFATYNIVYWCVTGFRHATVLQYSLYLARHVHTIGSKLTYAPVFEWRRGLWRYERSTINGIAFTSFPYVYLRGEEYRGIDVTVMFTIIKKLGYVLELRVVEPTDNSDSDVVHIVDSLSRIKDDIMLTRRHVDAGILPVVCIAEATYFCLVAPRAAEINLTQSLLRPFSYEVWLFIVGCAVAISVLNELSQYDTRMGVWLRWICSCPPLPSFYSTCFAVISSSLSSRISLR
ncbi:uncharacterized protein LOC120897370 [Anopheles arabiensis]|uniref:uncharacterized protein LOC120897370 n=1 Tax=Anopheles arabiensis TaxID=7173 RepID=UPI001AAD847D|nr:uncharacterized protein LOC120897370 [Anopheles arabiensis]